MNKNQEMMRLEKSLSFGLRDYSAARRLPLRHPWTRKRTSRKCNGFFPDAGILQNTVAARSRQRRRF